MAIETAVKIDVDVNGIQTVQQAATVYEDLGDAVAKTQREAEALALQFGINDKRTQDAIQRAGQYQGRLEQLDQAIAANRGGADQLFRSVQGLAAGFEIAAGAMALVGTESKDLEKLLVKVQGAMVLAQGLKDLNEFKGAIIGIATNIKNFLIPAFTGMRNALISSGIGAAVIAVGALVANFLRLKEASEQAAAAQKNYNDQLTALRNERKLLLEGEKAVVEETLRTTQARLKAGQDELKRQKEFNDEYYRGVEALGNQVRQSEIDRRNEKIKAQALENEQLLNEQLKLSKRLEELTSQEAKTNTKATKESVEEEKQTKSDFEEWTKKQREQSAKDLATFQGKQLQDTTGALQAQAAATIAATDIVIEQATDNSLSSIEKLKLGYKAFGEDTYNTFVGLFQAVAELELAFGNNSEKSQKKAFEIRKGIALADATITSIEATINAFDTAQESPITAFFPAYPFVQAGIAAAFGVAKIQQIRNQKYQGASTPPTGSVPSAGGNLNSFTAPTTRLPQGQDILTQERRVFVLEGDITRTQRRAATNQNVSVLGG
jgi:hypothetical protein